MELSIKWHEWSHGSNRVKYFISLRRKNTGQANELIKQNIWNSTFCFSQYQKLTSTYNDLNTINCCDEGLLLRITGLRKHALKHQ